MHEGYQALRLEVIAIEETDVVRTSGGGTVNNFNQPFTPEETQINVEVGNF